jgi:hypothetical protein
MKRGSVYSNDKNPCIYYVNPVSGLVSSEFDLYDDYLHSDDKKIVSFDDYIKDLIYFDLDSEWSLFTSYLQDRVKANVNIDAFYDDFIDALYEGKEVHIKAIYTKSGASLNYCP